MVAERVNPGFGLTSTFTVARLVNSIEHVPLFARMLNVVVRLKLPVGRSRSPPVPGRAGPTAISPASFRNW